MDGFRQLACVMALAMAGMSAVVTAQNHHLRLQDGLAWWQRSTPKNEVAIARVASLDTSGRVSLRPSLSRSEAVKAAPDASFDGTAVAIPASYRTLEPDEGGSVGDRVRDVVPRELIPYFDVYLYVSKAAHGAWAQHMFVFDKTSDDELAFEQSFPVSTGREKREKYFTSTPTGMFELDPARFFRRYHSHTWDGASMPWAMFLNYTIHGHETGIALHSAAEHVAALGHRASGGCVRLPPEKAAELFHRIRREERGLVPGFALDEARQTTLKDGTLARDEDGNILMQEGYKVLLIIENDSGAPTLVAELS
jgi:hypothetical protein